MSSEDKRIIKTMTEAGIPRTCWSVSIRDTGRQRYNEFAQNVADRKNRQGQSTVAYFRREEDGLLDVELMGKALVLAGLQVQYLPYHKLSRDLRLGEVRTDERSKTEDIYGKGAIIVPDLPRLSDLSDAEKTGYQEAVAYLVGHAYDGGVLVIGCTARLANRRVQDVPKVLERLLLETSEQFEVK